MHKPGKPIEPRVVWGLVYLYFVAAMAFFSRARLLDDLDGTFGLALGMMPPMLVPRRWLPLGFGISAATFLFFAGRWFLFYWQERSANGWPLPAAFLLASILFAVCAARSRARNASVP